MALLLLLLRCNCSSAASACCYLVCLEYWSESLRREFGRYFICTEIREIHHTRLRSTVYGLRFKTSSCFLCFCSCLQNMKLFRAPFWNSLQVSYEVTCLQHKNGTNSYTWPMLLKNMRLALRLSQNETVQWPKMLTGKLFIENNLTLFEKNTK